MKPFYINTFEISNQAKTLIIAEIAQAHDGSLGAAHAYIDAVANAGVDAIKFQAHFAEAESTRDERFRINFSYQDVTRYDYWKRIQFTPEQWAGLYQHAIEKNLLFLCSVFSRKAFDLMQALGVPAWKLSSGEVASTELIQAMMATKKPIIVSTGMSSYAEIDRLVTQISVNVPLILMQCTSKYPTPLSEVGLNVLQEFNDRYDVAVGLSDHSGSLFPSLAAISQGINALEVHATFDKYQFGPDVTSSVSIEQLSTIVAMSKAYQKMRSSPVNKDKIANGLKHTKTLFGKSLALVHSIRKGEQITRAMLTTKKPASGIPMTDINKVIGKYARCDLTVDHLLSLDDLVETYYET